jgi:hypothetical protein
MLIKDPFIVHPDTIKLIKELQAIEKFKEFYLVGGTALALQLGHRNSIDIDLFTANDFHPDTIESILTQGKFAYKFTLSRDNTLLAVVNNIKTDFITLGTVITF